MDVARQLFSLESIVRIAWASPHQPLHDKYGADHRAGEKQDRVLAIAVDWIEFPVAVNRNSKGEVAKPRTDEQVLGLTRHGWYLKGTLSGRVVESNHPPQIGTIWEGHLGMENWDPALAQKILAAYRAEEARLRDLMAAHG